MFKQYYNTSYDIYDDGRCFSHLSNKFLTPKMSVKYPTYNLTIDGKKKQIKIHRMVAETFILNPENKPIVNHKDGDTHNFHITNLEWVTFKENAEHAYNTGLRKNGNQTINKYISNLPNEEWTNISEYPNYLISSCGRVMNKKTKRLLKLYLNHNGYYIVNLWKNNTGKNFLVHSLVYSNFNNDYELSGYVINHIDGNKKNNQLNNLEKTSYQKNNLHACYIIKTHKQEKPVNQLNNEYQIIKTFPSIASAQRETNISNISRAIHKKGKAGGFYWSFK